MEMGFDNAKFLEEQSRRILERVKQFGGKLYLEVGGKIIQDLHAARVLPGFDPDVKIQLLRKLRDTVEVIVCIYADDIQGKAVRGDLGVSSDLYALKMIDDLRTLDVVVDNVVITRFSGQVAAKALQNKLERRGVKVYLHKPIAGYPDAVEQIVSDDGFGSNERIETQKPLVIVVGPSANSGKLATCLSQLYHDGRAGVQSGYAKFETFPVWNLPLRHPLNLAYEAATADIGDINLIDPFHLEAYGQTAVNYNRDIEVFPVVERILEKVTGQKNVYKSPTDMGVNCIGFAIVNDKVVQEASKQEIIRRFFRYSGEYARGLGNEEAVEKTKSLLVELNIRPEMRRVVEPARQAAAEAKAKGKGNKGVYVGAALELSDGTLMTGKNSELLHASSSLFINTVKFLAAIPDETHLLSPRLIASLGQLKENIFGEKNISLDLEETLIALSIDAATNPITARALAQIGQLQGCEVHLTHLSKAGDENTWRKLGVNLTSDAVFPSPNLSEL